MQKVENKNYKILIAVMTICIAFSVPTLITFIYQISGLNKTNDINISSFFILLFPVLLLNSVFIAPVGVLVGLFALIRSFVGQKWIRMSIGKLRLIAATCVVVSALSVVYLQIVFRDFS